MRTYFKNILLTVSLLLYSFTTSAQAETFLEDLNGKNIPLSSLKGKWVYINYWASWCGPCLDEISELNRFYEKNKINKVVVYAVNYDGLSVSKQRRLVNQFGIHYPSLKPSSVKSLRLGPISVVPITYVFNPKGEFVTTLYGGQTMRSLHQAMVNPTA